MGPSLTCAYLEYLHGHWWVPLTLIVWIPTVLGTLLLFHLITFEVVTDLQYNSKATRSQSGSYLEDELASKTTVAAFYRAAVSAFRDQPSEHLRQGGSDDDDHITTRRLEGEDCDAFFPRFEMPKTRHRPSTILAYLCVFYTIVMSFGIFLIIMAAVTAALWYNAQGEMPI